MGDGLPVMCAFAFYLFSLYLRVGQHGGMAGVLVGADIERMIGRVDAYSSGMSSGEMGCIGSPKDRPTAALA